MDRGHLQRLVFVQRRHQAGQAAGEQRLAGTGRPAEQQVVRAGGRYQQRTLGRGLALHFRQVGIRRRHPQQAVGLVGAQAFLAIEVRGQLQQVTDRVDGQAAGQAGLLGVFPRDHQRAARGAGGEGGGQHAGHRAQRAGKRQLAQAFQLLQAGGIGQLAAGGEDAQGDGQVEAPAVLGQVGRGEIERDSAVGEIEA